MVQQRIVFSSLRDMVHGVCYVLTEYAFALFFV